MDSSGLNLESLAPQVAPGVRILPIVHGRLEMAVLVRAVLTALEPKAVAVELPSTLAAVADEAVARLPKVSVILSEAPSEAAAPSHAGAPPVGGQTAGEALVWIVAPGDPFAEALRWAQERDRPRFLIDADLHYGEAHGDPLPDPYAMWSLGPEAYLGYLAEAVGGQGGASPADALREAAMAFNLQTASKTLQEGDLLALVGVAHAERLGRAVATPKAEPLIRRRRSRVTLRHLHPKSFTAVFVDPPLAHAAFEVLRRGEVPPPVELDNLTSIPVSLVRHGLRVLTGTPEEDPAERDHRRVHYAARHAHRLFAGLPAPDRGGLGPVVWQVSCASYTRQTGEKTALWQRRLFFDFTRRYTRTQGLLVPGLYEWVVAARGVGDDNLAWEVFDVTRTFPWQREKAEIPSAEIDGDTLDLGTRKVRFRRRFFRVKRRLVPVRRRPTPEDPSEWLEAFDADGLCSYPPEDLVIEDYGRFLQHKAVSILSAERARTEPFTTSLLEGIDLRETLRHLSEGRIYVRESGRVPGKAGSVVVVFDADLEGRGFPYLMTWHGEHEQESDMAFYSTHPVEHVVGPGIMRATYGGLLLTHPPRRLYDVWQDPDYRVLPGGAAASKPEVLLLAAVDYSPEKIVVHVGPTPPSGRLHSHATAQGKRILHIPLGSLSPLTLKKIRVVHLLVGRDKRQIAKDYLW